MSMILHITYHNLLKKDFIFLGVLFKHSASQKKLWAELKVKTRKAWICSPGLYPLLPFFLFFFFFLICQTAISHGNSLTHKTQKRRSVHELRERNVDDSRPLEEKHNIPAESFIRFNKLSWSRISSLAFDQRLQERYKHMDGWNWDWIKKKHTKQHHHMMCHRAAWFWCIQ